MSLCSWNGCMVAGGDNRGGVALWDARVNEPVYRFTTGSRASRRAVFSVDGTARVLALAGISGSAHLFDIAARKEIIKKKICSLDVNVLCFSPRMRLLLASDAQSLRLVNLQNISMSTFPDPTHHILTFESVTDTRPNSTGDTYSFQLGSIIMSFCRACNGPSVAVVSTGRF
uniref:WD_REPEATS_REGION domain-containing protein n=1 Tax=Angiostrongylus cantonensis TaxID=6313 RepID=A0A0K0D7Z2_ANGCA